METLDISAWKPLKSNFSTNLEFNTLACVTQGTTRISIDKTNFPFSFKSPLIK